MKIMMVCLGNICRSPLAEGIMQDLVLKHDLDWIVTSSGTSGFHNGERPHRNSISVAKLHGIDISGQVSTQFSLYDFDEYDHILVMDQSNYKHVVHLARDHRDSEKVHLLMSFHPDPIELDVPDPYYTGGFEKVYRLIEAACLGFIEHYS